MNLQVCVPYQKCPFKCPMCIASGRPIYENGYKNNYEDYMHNLIMAIGRYDTQDIVLTGNTEPTLDRTWMTTISRVIKNIYPNIPIELQTKNYNLKGFNLSNIDVLSYSITNSKEYLKAWNFRKIKRTNRLVILLTKEFDFLTADNFNAFGFEQITFKVLQYGADKVTNKWVDKNKLEDLTNIYNIVSRFNGSDTSVRIDTNCQNSVNRYKVFREDGITYKEW